MDVRYPSTLEPAGRLLRSIFDVEQHARTESGLVVPSADAVVSWITLSREGIGLPLLLLANPTEDTFLLRTYFERALESIARSEAEALAILTDGIGVPRDLEAIAEAGSGALRRFDQEAAVHGFDTTRAIEWYVHDTSPYHTAFVAQMGAYDESKRVMTPSNRNDYAKSIVSLGEELVERELIRSVRSGSVSERLSGTFVPAPFTNRGWYFIVKELLGIYGITPTLDENGEVIVDERIRAPLTGAAKRIEHIAESYPQIARYALRNALENHPNAIAQADRTARSPQEWIALIS